MSASGAGPDFPLAPPLLRRPLVFSLVFWDFARASWQYDVVVALILLFIFATPRSWFHDLPRASGVVLMSSTAASNRFFIDGEMLAGVDPAQLSHRAEALIHERTGKKWHVTRLEPITDEQEHETRGFIAYTSQ